jgi:hypothetical protein
MLISGRALLFELQLVSCSPGALSVSMPRFVVNLREAFSTFINSTESAV